MSNNRGVELEELTIHLPKQVMDLLRIVEHLEGTTPDEFIQHSILSTIQAYANTNELIPNMCLIEKFNLTHLYK
jgi:hypothetical protein